MKECYICGRKRKTRKYTFNLWDFGVRTSQRRDACESCISAERRGIL